jgi:glycosyltransferase involved in cell wall biosynthesis
VETPRRKYPGLHEFQSYFFAKELQQSKIDLVIGNTFSAASRIKKLCAYAGLPLVNYVREYVKGEGPNLQILNKIDNLFVISQDLVSYLSGFTDQEKLLLTYNFINPKPILDLVKQHKNNGNPNLFVDQSQPVIGLIARITPFKQQDVFIKAVPHVLKKFPNAKFVIIGSAQPEDYPYQEKLHQITQDCDVSESVQFMGHRSDVIELTAELTISCLTSSREPLGRVILEAGILGIPVIVPDCGGPAEIVIHGKTGLTFDSNHPDAHLLLAAHIITLLENKPRRDKLALAAKKRIMSKFASENPINRQIELMKKIIYDHNSQK